MATQTLDLWTLVRGRPQIDPNDLAEAVVNQAAEEDLDYRTRLLIRDSVDALRDYWGALRLERWFNERPYQERITKIIGEQFDEVGFPSIKKRLMDTTDPETVKQYFRQLGQELRETVKIAVAGGCALILPGY